MNITASSLYDYIKCPHKVWRDIYGPQEEKIQETNPFVKLLWEKGVKHEERVVSELGDFLNLKEGSIDIRFQKTIEAMENKVPLIYQGVLKHENVLGIPDLLKLLPDNTYIPIDIKSGMGFEGADKDTGSEGKPKKHYAVQLCLYNDLLKTLGFANHNNGKIIDIHGKEVEYDLTAPMGVRIKETWWECYEEMKKDIDLLMKNKNGNKPALAGTCKLCPWYNSCKKWCEGAKDLTTIFYLGRSNRDRIAEDLSIEDVDAFLDINVAGVMERKKAEKKAGNNDFLLRIGDKSLQKSIDRARILYQTKKPVLYGSLTLPTVSYELFFDIEDDPTQEFIYLHGIYERNGSKGRYIYFAATELLVEAEKEAWGKFWEYIGSLPQDDYAVYYYSHHEKTTYKNLQKRYPDVISMEEVEKFFDNPNVIDLYKIVLSQTDWPVGSYSLKALATYSGFSWRDETPSGALSIQWFNDYIESKDENILKRILEYNEDDCKATMVLKDKLVELSDGNCVNRDKVGVE
ncbi:MAG TPA: TM0106 family RecB-like putative nuclease [Marinobacter sp.]|uniref:YprB ribonuclease H-like domain-containing protein n=1 Tax=marine sediment metagenome TaxID=412755 RepID=A0A0F9QAV5_9ZZZZ|nr:TM0106 family RecB-like putative nuclease [Marinobacter sp.]